MITLRRIPRSQNRPYLQRYGRGAQDAKEAREDRKKGTWRARLHHFVGRDDAGHHNHPFKWSFSIVLWGSYTEEVLSFQDYWDGCVFIPNHSATTLTRRVRWFNWIPNGKYHRITKLHGNVWTLFVTGPRVSSWGFWVPGRGHVPWKIHNAEKGSVSTIEEVI